MTNKQNKYTPPERPGGAYYTTEEVMQLLSKSKEQIRYLKKQNLLKALRFQLAGNRDYFAIEEVEALKKKLEQIFAKK